MGFSIKLANEELEALSSELAEQIRASGLPRPNQFQLNVDGFANKESELTKLIARSAKITTIERVGVAINCISEEIHKQFGCRIVHAFYNGAGSFNCIAERAHYRNELAYTILAQAALLDSPEKHGLAKNVLQTHDEIVIFPLCSQVENDEYYHGMIILLFDENKMISETEKSKLGFFAYCLSKEMGDNCTYSVPAVNGGGLQQHVESGLIGGKKLFCEELIAKPAIGLRFDKNSSYDFGRKFDEIISKNVFLCHEKPEALSRISNVLKKSFIAESCFFMKYARGKFEKIGSPSVSCNEKIYQNVASVSAMMGAPYQTIDGNLTVISIPHYAGGDFFVGASVIHRNINEPPLEWNVWRLNLCFCHHIFNALYAKEENIPSNLYSKLWPWDGYIKTWNGCNFASVPAFPPSLSRKYEDIEKFGEKEFSQISGWLLKYLKQRKFPWGGQMTYYKELEGGLDLHQSTTTTIMDLCSRAGQSEWSKTTKSIFGEVPKFFGKEETYLMWLAVHEGEGRFKTYHSGDGELEKEDACVCEILAQWTTIENKRFFLSADDPEPISKLLRSRIGEFSFVVMPIYAEDEIRESDGGWGKNGGDLIGVFVLAMSPQRKEPTSTEWLEWGMFIPRLYFIMKAAREKGKLEFCVKNVDHALARIEKMLL